MTEPQWVFRETVLALQELLLAEFGGAAGLRDEGVFDSALARPENRLAYEQAGICDLAAAYAFGLVRNHPFIDGNKRIGFTVAVLFLELNGWTFVATEADAVIQTLALAASVLDQAEYSAWLKVNSVPATA
ncbi:type II toxin-antitoxin system death-on-curing family toxin [Verrucomicrobium spinosum]|uniref:type II toxin-antitoxin system death-on-curing family toxin n=1 Tax=Verrucomicrobium spinosum TaxID=2736 RepID=UPI0001746129|nr:type II toxin-antitoxin system death-on-curing family toxin [Verrucomicrobium spinosum]